MTPTAQCEVVSFGNLYSPSGCDSHCDAFSDVLSMVLGNTEKKASFFAEMKQDLECALSELDECKSRHEKAQKSTAELNKALIARDAYKNHFLALRECGDDTIEHHLAALDPVFRSWNYDDGLIEAFKGVYRRKRGTCGRFCRMAVEEAASGFFNPETAGAIGIPPEELDKEKAAATEEEKQAAAGVSNAQKKVAMADEDMRLAEEDLQNARVAECNAKAVLEENK